MSRRRARICLACVTLALTAGGTADAAAGDRAPSDRATIVATLDAWPDAWARRDAGAICGLFARDVVFSFQGGKDRRYGQACAQFRTIVADRTRTFRYRPPKIESVDVDGDLAAVRLIWTVTVRKADGTLLERAREKGLDVLRRGADGTWRIIVSYAYPLT
jgi:uncharacterized protein (TIGR02246 family)